IRVKQKQLNLGVGTERMIFNIDYVMKHSYSNDDTCFSIDVIDEILEEDFDALLDEGSKILHSNLVHTLGDYSKPSHKGYRNTIEILEGSNVVPLRSDTICLVQNGYSFHRLRSEDP
nr:reverse transcriptase domain-containing protein [Tanacetum cinerariifolium]